MCLFLECWLVANLSNRERKVVLMEVYILFFLFFGNKARDKT